MRNLTTSMVFAVKTNPSPPLSVKFMQNHSARHSLCTNTLVSYFYRLPPQRACRTQPRKFPFNNKYLPSQIVLLHVEINPFQNVMPSPTIFDCCTQSFFAYPVPGIGINVSGELATSSETRGGGGGGVFDSNDDAGKYLFIY